MKTNPGATLALDPGRGIDFSSEVAVSGSVRCVASSFIFLHGWAFGGPFAGPAPFGVPRAPLCGPVGLGPAGSSFLSFPPYNKYATAENLRASFPFG